MEQIDDKVLAEIESEYAKWAEFLNGGIGLLSFSFALSCLGTDRPDLTGFISLVFMLVVAIHGSHRFPQRLKKLRATKLSGINELILIGFEKKYFSILAGLKYYPIYFFGWLFLGGVALYGVAKNALWL